MFELNSVYNPLGVGTGSRCFTVVWIERDRAGLVLKDKLVKNVVEVKDDVSDV